jgi:hypothetical protein
MQNNKASKMRIALQGVTKAPKLHAALNLAYGLCGQWGKIVVITCAIRQDSYQHLGNYNTLHIPQQATPQRYIDVFDLCVTSGKEVVIFNSFSEEWSGGVEAHLNTAYYQEVLSAHGLLMRVLRNASVHVICCIDTHYTFVKYDPKSRRSFSFMQLPVQQEGFERNFMEVVRINPNGLARVLKDVAEVLPQGFDSYVTPIWGASLQDWCDRHDGSLPPKLKQRIADCNSIDELNRLSHEEEPEDEMTIAAFTKRRLELEAKTSTSIGTNLSDIKLQLVK